MHVMSTACFANILTAADLSLVITLKEATEILLYSGLTEASISQLHTKLVSYHQLLHTAFPNRPMTINDHKSLHTAVSTDCRAIKCGDHITYGC